MERLCFSGKICTIKDGTAQCLTNEEITVDDDNAVETDEDTVVEVDEDMVVETDEDTVVETDEDAVVETDEDAVVEVDEDTVVEVDRMITKIQKGEVSLNSEVAFEAVVVAVVHDQDSYYNNVSITGIFVSEIIDDAAPYSGIYVSFSDSVLLGSFAEGDKVEVSGVYKENYDNSEIESTLSQVTKTGVANLPNPVKIADTTTVATPFVDTGDYFMSSESHGVDSEKYESVLIEVYNNIEITIKELGHGEFEVRENLAIDKMIYYYPGDRTVGSDFEYIKGILIYSYKAFRLAPRKNSDFKPLY